MPTLFRGWERAWDERRAGHGDLQHHGIHQASHAKVGVAGKREGLASRHRHVLEWIRGALRGLSYWVSCRVLNAKDHGVPQNRERLFIVGIHQLGAPDAANLFKWPTKMPAVCLEDFLDPKDESDNPRRLPPKSQTIARKHVQCLLAALRKEGLDPTTARLIVDCDGTKCHSMCGVSPCLTRTRCSNGGHWVLSRGRRLTTQEQERLFGLHVQPPSGGRSVAVQRPPAVSVRAWGAIIGNSIPVPMLARVLCKALPAAGLLPGAVRDVWDPREKWCPRLIGDFFARQKHTRRPAKPQLHHQSEM